MAQIEIHFLLEADGPGTEKDVHELLAATAGQRGEDYSAGRYLSTAWNRYRWGELYRVRLNGYDDASEPEHVSVPDVPHLTLQLPTDTYEGFGKDRYDLGQQIGDLLELIELVYLEIHDRVRVVLGLSSPHRERIVVEDMPLPVTDEGLASNRIEYISWLVILPPPFLETYGKDILLSAPGWHVEELDDGAVLIVAYENPANEGNTQQLDEYLGLESPDVKDMFY